MQFKLDNRAVPDDTILVIGIRYDDQTSDKIFSYVWLKAGGLWYSTGNARVPTAAAWSVVERWLAAEGRNVVWIDLVTARKRVYSAQIEGFQAIVVTVDEEPNLTTLK